MRDRSPIQSVALAVGLVFLLVGILGFVPGVTSNYGDLKFAGHGSLGVGMIVLGLALGKEGVRRESPASAA